MPTIASPTTASTTTSFSLDEMVDFLEKRTKAHYGKYGSKVPLKTEKERKLKAILNEMTCIMPQDQVSKISKLVSVITGFNVSFPGVSFTKRETWLWTCHRITDNPNSHNYYTPFIVQANRNSELIRMHENTWGNSLPNGAGYYRAATRDEIRNLVGWMRDRHSSSYQNLVDFMRQNLA